MSYQGYNIKKTAQVAAFFAKQSNGKIAVLKLAKLLYLADREALRLYDRPILFDRFVSMPHGPVTSLTLDYISGYVSSPDWEKYISDKENHETGLSDSNLTEDDLDLLSKAELNILHSVWSQFGGMGKWEIRDYTHSHCPEWEDPDGSSTSIPYERVFKVLGKQNPKELADHVEATRSLISA